MWDTTLQYVLYPISKELGFVFVTHVDDHAPTLFSRYFPKAMGNSVNSDLRDLQEKLQEKLIQAAQGGNLAVLGGGRGGCRPAPPPPQHTRAPPPPPHTRAVRPGRLCLQRPKVQRPIHPLHAPQLGGGGAGARARGARGGARALRPYHRPGAVVEQRADAGARAAAAADPGWGQGVVEGWEGGQGGAPHTHTTPPRTPPQARAWRLGARS